MRKYLFRGFCRDFDGKEEILLNGERITGKWVEGCYLHDLEHNREHITNCSKYCVEVIPETVCDFTGMMDKQGNKCFLHDRLRFTNDEGDSSDYVIKWDQKNCKYYIEEAVSGCLDDFDSFVAENSEVVGHELLTNLKAL